MDSKAQVLWAEEERRKKSPGWKSPGPTCIS